MKIGVRRSAVSAEKALFAMLMAAFALRVILIVLLRGKQTHDSRIFISWSHLLMRYGTHGLYAHVDTIDHYPVNYPPLFGLILAAVVSVYQWLKPQGGQDTILLAMLSKLPAITADILLCVLAFWIVRRWATATCALVAAAIAAFAPSTWPISAVWGQVDSIAATFMVLALALTMSKRYALAWGALALAVLVKPLPIVIGPLLLAAQIVDDGVSPRLVLGPLLGVAVGYVTSLPFAPAFAPSAVLVWLEERFAAGQALSDATSVNAYNVWTVAARPMPDSLTLFGVSLHAWGWLAFGTFAGVTTVALFVRMTSEHDRGTRERLLAVACFAVLVALFLFATRMHERYILFALALAPLMWFCGRWQRRAAFTLIVTFTLCVVLVLGFYERKVFGEVGVVTHALSLINLASLAMVSLAFMRGEAGNRLGRPS